MPEAEGRPITRPSEQTRAAEAREAAARHTSDRAPTDEEERLAEDSANDPAAAERLRSAGEHVRDMAERGAAGQGEGRIP